MRANASAARRPARSPCGARLVVQLRPRTGPLRLASSGRSSIAIVERHWLRCASSASILRSTMPSTFSTWSTRAGFEAAAACRAGAARGPVRGRSADRARRRCPPIVEQAGVRGGRDGSGTAATDRARARRRAGPRGSRAQTAARVASVARRARRRRSGGSTTSTAPRTAAASRCSSSRVAISAARSASASQVPLDPSVQTHIVHVGAGGGPLRERGAAAELDVVGVRADRERARGCGEIDADRHGAALRRDGLAARSSAARSAATSTSKPSVVVADDAHLEAEPLGLGGVAGAEPGRTRTRRRPRPGARAPGCRRRGDRGRSRRPGGAVVGDRVERRSRAGDRRARRRRARGLRRAPTSRPAAAAASSEPGSATTSTPSARAHATTSGALETIDDRAAARRRHDALGHRAGEARARASSASTAARRALPR